MTVSQPTINDKPYDAISLDRLAGTAAGKVVIVTGAGGGLGSAEALAFAQAGATLALIDIPRGQAALTKTAERCVAAGAKVCTYLCSVVDEAESAATLERIVSELGPVDVLVNNAGGSNDRPFHMQTFAQFWSMIDLNFKAPMLWMHMLVNEFRARGKGTIINIASRSGTVNTPFAVNYAAAKTALIRAVACLQLELDMDGFADVDVYALHPGATKTNIQKDLDPDVAAAYPHVATLYREFCKLFRCEPALCGQTCVYLAAGRGKALRGRYFDCEQDIGYVSGMADEIRTKNLYDLKVEFLGGLPNDGGTVKDDALVTVE